MAHLGEAILRYHQLFRRAGYRNLAWAESLEQRLREQRLMDSGRLLAPALRPQFLLPRQLELLSGAAAQLSCLIDQMVQLALHSPALLNQLKLLPAEKMLAMIDPGYSGCGSFSRFEVLVENGSFSVCGVNASQPADMVTSDQVAELFLSLPILKDFTRGKYKLSKLGSLARLHAAILQTWREFGGRDQPNIAILDCNQCHSSWGQSQALEESLRQANAAVRLVSPEELVYAPPAEHQNHRPSDNKSRKLRAGDFSIDVILRCVSVRELLIRCGLTHPLFAAYRDRAVCVINNFRAELACRRALLDLLTDEACTSHLDTISRRLIRSLVPWTRLVAPRKTTYKGETVDLLPFVLANREKLVLRPNEDLSSQPVFLGAAMDRSSWERALRLACQSPYVVQEACSRSCEPFPIFHYGELHMREVEVFLHTNLFHAQLQGASAALQVSSSKGSHLVGIAPVLLLETLEGET
jgi:hypothetical protein